MKKPVLIIMILSLMMALCSCGKTANTELFPNQELENILNDIIAAAEESPASIDSPAVSTTVEPNEESSEDASDANDLPRACFSVTAEEFVNAFNSANPSMKIELNPYGSHSIFGGGMEFVIFFLKDGDEIKTSRGDSEFDTLIIRVDDQVSYQKTQNAIYLSVMLVGYRAAAILDPDFSQDEYSNNGNFTADGYSAVVNGINYMYRCYSSNLMNIPSRVYEFSCETK